MRKSLFLVALAGLGAVLVPSAKPQAQSQVFWQTSFNCPEWTTTDGIADDKVCASGDQIVGWGGWATGAGKYDQITLAANNPAGNGRGYRHWRGEGTSNNGGGIRLDLPNRPMEVWVRWYMRYQQGFAWEFQQQTKELYFNSGGTNQGAGNSFTLGFHDGGSTFGTSIVTPRSQNLFGPPGWNTIMGGPVGDGRWHYYETHINARTGQTLAESWVDGRLAHRHTIDPYTNTPLDFNNSPILYILVGSNSIQAKLGQPDMYVDYDDFAFSTTGYIGPIGGGSSGGGGGSSASLPSAPANLRVVP